jgi:hypothetical protein
MNRSLERTGLLMLLLAAGSIRLYLANRIHVATIDTAIVGQMAVQILEGSRPLFFAGQNYMGALEAYTLALFFLVVEPGHTTMALATILFALLWILATYIFFRVHYGSRAAFIAALVPAFPGWTPIWYTTVPYGGYPQTYFFGMLTLILALKLGKALRPATVWMHAFMMAGIAALGIWTNLQYLPYLASAALFGLWVAKKSSLPPRYWAPYLVLLPLLSLAAFGLQFAAEPAHVSQQVYSGYSLAAFARSWRGLWAHDIPHCVLWTYPPAWLHVWVSVALITTLITAITLACTQRQRRKPITMLSWGMVLVFFLIYFMHPMSGFVPRYLIAPIILMLSWTFGRGMFSSQAVIRRLFLALAILLALYNIKGTLHVANARHAGKVATLETYNKTIAIAREQEFTALLHAGSETEGYDAARLTFTSDRLPVFASGFSDRFLDHQLSWEFGLNQGYLSHPQHLDFILGSYEALAMSPRHLREKGAFALIDNPHVARRFEQSVMPDHIYDFLDNPSRHPLFDRNTSTLWQPDNAGSTQPLLLHFEQPIRVSGIRVTAPTPQELPYRYHIRAQRPDGTWQIVAESQRRIAASYLSGDRVYFRGHDPWMDVRFDPIWAVRLEWLIEPGRANTTATRLEELFILETSEGAWPLLDPVLEVLISEITECPKATIITERGIMRLLHRHAEDRGLPESIRKRLPLPYNPRFAKTQPNRMILPHGPTLLLVETGYATEILQTLGRSGHTAQVRDLPPFSAIYIDSAIEAVSPLSWRGFTILE